MKEHIFQTQLLIESDIHSVFDFFQKAENLELITPPWLQFRIVSPPPYDSFAGKLFEYKLKIHGFPVMWKSIISIWEPPYRFVDEQLKGPYKKWVHEHRFESTPYGVLMTDTVNYKLPFGVLGDIVRYIKVQKDIQEIFAYRNQIILDYFEHNLQSKAI